MREQSVDAILGDRQLRIVVIVGVDGHAVREGSKARGQAKIAADDRTAIAIRETERSQIAARDVAGLRDGTREREPQPIEHRTLAEVRDIAVDRDSGRADDEFGDIGGQR